MTDHGLLPPDSVARRLNRELFLLLGGTAALLLQVAHPLVAGAVDRHSSFRRDPLGRLRRTVDMSLAPVFADSATARSVLRRIDARHGSVTGAATDGRRYDARDPELGLWVQTTLVLTSLRLAEAVLGRLDAADRQRYWDEAKVIGRELGIPERVYPPTIADLERYERDMLATEVVPDATARAVAADVLRPLRGIPDALYWPSDALAAALLPPALRAAFGLRFGTAQRRFVRGVIVAVRIARAVLPQRLVTMPHARVYEERQAGNSSGVREYVKKRSASRRT